MVKETRYWVPLTQKQLTDIAYILFLFRPVAISDAYELLAGGPGREKAATNNHPPKSVF
jgi:hypothetical protein